MKKLDEIIENIKFGVDYYPEHWPEERWETDAELMEKMGIQMVRMAEFSWHKMEPRCGEFHFEWLDRAVNLLGRHGICSELLQQLLRHGLLKKIQKYFLWIQMDNENPLVDVTMIAKAIRYTGSM